MHGRSTSSPNSNKSGNEGSSSCVTVCIKNKSSAFELHYEYEGFINDLLRKDMKQTKVNDFLSK